MLKGFITEPRCIISPEPKYNLERSELLFCCRMSHTRKQSEKMIWKMKVFISFQNLRFWNRDRKVLQFCLNPCFENTNLFNCDSYIKEQFEYNVNLIFVYIWFPQEALGTRTLYLAEPNSIKTHKTHTHTLFQYLFATSVYDVCYPFTSGVRNFG